MVSDEEFSELVSAVQTLEIQVSSLEEERRSRNSVQSVVGPPDAAISRSESGRWPDRQTVAKIKRSLENWFQAQGNVAFPWDIHTINAVFYEELRKHLEAIDKGEGGK